MKLLFCPKCQDIRKLLHRRVFCECGASYGNYLEDSLSAVIGGKAIPIGFDNHSFQRALENRPKKGRGERFDAFVIADHCDTIFVTGESWSRHPIQVEPFDELRDWIEKSVQPQLGDPDLVVVFDDSVVRKITIDLGGDADGSEISLDIGFDRHHAHHWIDFSPKDSRCNTHNAVVDIKKRFHLVRREPLPL